jgi:pilus assembly protein CpaB
MGKFKIVIPLSLAIVIAGASSLFLYKWIRSMKPQTFIEKSEEMITSPVVVSAYYLPWGTQVTKDMLKTVNYPTGTLPQGTFSESDKIIGRIIITPIIENEPILMSKLAAEDVKLGGVAAVLKPGKRAMAVKGDKVIGISGFIRPGNLVDVFVTVKNPETKKDTTKLVLDKIPVLATGQEIQADGKKKASPVDVYTLEVSPEEGEKLALAATQGKLQFALRNIKDGETVLTRGATIAETLNSLSVKKTPPKRRVKSKRVYPRLHTIEVITGDKVVKRKMHF